MEKRSKPRTIGVVDEVERPALQANLSADRAVIAQAPIQPVVASQESVPTDWTYDPCEYLPSGTGLVARCQKGRFDSWKDGRVEQCHMPAARGAKNCSDHGGVAVAKKVLQENAVLMITELVRIALDPDEKTANKIAALNSGLDRAGGLGRTVAQPEPEVRSALMARLEAAYDQVVAAQAEGRAPAEAVVAAQEHRALHGARDGAKTVDQTGAPVEHAVGPPPASNPGQ